MSPIGSMIIIAGVTLALSIGAVQAIEWIDKRRKRTRRVTIITHERNSEIVGDRAWINLPEVHVAPKSARVRDIGVRGA